VARDPADPRAEEAALRPTDVLDTLVAAHRRFRSFLERRVGNAADAEEILQAAYVKTVERGEAIRDGESAVAWFYRLLRNAVADHHRRGDAERRALEARARETPPTEGDDGLHGAVCQCLHDLLPTLKAEYRDIVRKVDLEGVAIARVAAERGVTPNNARVLLHRARKALRRQLEASCGTCTEHGCLDCSCGG
jgi:RNA polymerase sigma factor (sigma-70 family)